MTKYQKALYHLHNLQSLLQHADGDENPIITALNAEGRTLRRIAAEEMLSDVSTMTDPDHYGDIYDEHDMLKKNRTWSYEHALHERSSAQDELKYIYQRPLRIQYDKEKLIMLLRNQIHELYYLVQYQSKRKVTQSVLDIGLDVAQQDASVHNYKNGLGQRVKQIQTELDLLKTLL